MVQHGWRPIEYHDVDFVRSKRTHQVGGKLGRVAVRRARGETFIDLYRDVDVAMQLRPPRRVRPKQIGLLHLGACLQCARNAEAEIGACGIADR